MTCKTMFTLNFITFFLINLRLSDSQSLRFTSDCILHKCKECYSFNNTMCKTCEDGYYTDDSYSCLSCSETITGCSQCSSSNYCTRCQNGKEPMNVYSNFICTYKQCSYDEYYDYHINDCNSCTDFGRLCKVCSMDGCVYYDYYYDIWDDWVVYTCLVSVFILIITIILVCRRRRGIVPTRAYPYYVNNYPGQQSYNPPVPSLGYQSPPSMPYAQFQQGVLPIHQPHVSHQIYGQQQITTVPNNPNEIREGNNQVTTSSPNLVEARRNNNTVDNQTTNAGQGVNSQPSNSNQGNTNNINNPQLNYPNFN